MNKGNFLDFITEKKYLTEDKLLSALVGYESEQKPLAELLFENKIFNSEELLVILRAQQNGDIDILQAAKTLKEEYFEKIKNYISLRDDSSDFIYYLMREGHIDSNSISKALDEYLSCVNFNESSNNVFCEKKYKILVGQISLWRDLDLNKDRDAVVKILKNLISELYKLKIEFKGIQFDFATELLASLEKKALIFTQKKLFFELESKKKFAEFLINFYHILFEMNKSYLKLEGAREQKNEAQFKQNYDRGYSLIQEYSF